jgi:AcrR family transcriptional regulator
MPRNSNATREKILGAAFVRFHKDGFRAASIRDILEDTGLTKGALYHHFPSKAALGYAVVDEHMRYLISELAATFASTDDPISTMQDLIRTRVLNAPWEMLRMGCPLTNLAEEMSHHDDGFYERVSVIFAELRSVLAGALARGQTAGTVRSDISAEGMALTFVCFRNGLLGLAKRSQDRHLVTTAVSAWLQMLEGLRP